MPLKQSELSVRWLMLALLCLSLIGNYYAVRRSRARRNSRFSASSFLTPPAPSSHTILLPRAPVRRPDGNAAAAVGLVLPDDEFDRERGCVD